MNQEPGENKIHKLPIKKIALVLIVGVLLVFVSWYIYPSNRSQKNAQEEVSLSQENLEKVSNKQTFFNNVVRFSFSVPDYFQTDFSSSRIKDIFPTIFLTPNVGNVGDDCYYDCIQTTAFIRTIVDNHQRSLPWYDLDLEERLNDKSNFRYRNQYYYKVADEWLGVGNYQASRFVGAGKMDTDNQGQSSGKYLVAEKVYVYDPYQKNRILMFDYQRILDDLSFDESKANIEQITREFDETQHEIFEHILDSLEILPPETELVYGEINQLGLAIQFPQYWGTIKSEVTSYKPFSEIEGFSVIFKSPAVGKFTSNPRIYVQVHSEETDNWSYEALGNYLAQYSGQPLEEYCENDGYIGKLYRNITVSKCELLTSENGVQVGVISGTYADTGGYGPEITPEYWNHRYFKIASVRTKSEKWKGFNLVLEDAGSGFLENLTEFDSIVSSFTYLEK